MDGLIEFDAFSFDPSIGEIIKSESDGSKSVTRLPPQPSQLLLLLLDRYPEILSHEEIKNALWPDVQVDFDRSLHYCVRQIRSALNESASDPQFIQTIPRRGYRWIIPFKNGATVTTPARQNKTFSKIKRDSTNLSIVGNKLKKPEWFTAILILSVLIFLYYGVTFLGKADPMLEIENPSIRVAIMPIQPALTSAKFHNNNISFQLVERLSNEDENKYLIIGPTTTINYQQNEIRKLIKDYNIDYVINGKFSIENDTNKVLIEVIRKDGVHSWVKRFNYSENETEIIKNTVDGINFIDHKL